MEGVMRRFLRALVLVAVGTFGSASSAVVLAQIRIVSPTYPTRAINPNPQRFDPTAFAWRTRTTDHFDIYHTQQADLEQIAREAERAYSRLSLDLRHNLPVKVPLILLPTDRDLPRDRQEATELVRASGAPNVDHLLLPVEPRDRRTTALAHELTHIFQYELVPHSRVARWAAEGLADHMTDTWQSSDLLKIRELAAADLIPPIASLADSDRAWGHAVFDFIAAEYGAQGVRRYLIALRDISASPDDIIRAAFSVTPPDFERAFHAYVRTRLTPH
jgi:hypothetical protein